MNKNYKNIAIAITFLILGTGIGYTYSNMKNKETATIANNQNNVPIKQSINNCSDMSNKSAKELSKDSSKIVVPSSSDIVIYNSHAHEDYASGMKVTDVGSTINDKLVEENLKSSFIQCDPPMEYNKAYEITHDLIIENVEDYSNKILLDIHRDKTDDNESDTKKILLVLAKDNSHYEENEKFADLLLTEIGKSKGVNPSILEFKKGPSHFNQDLSNQSILIELGNNMSSDDDINECINALVSALENIEKDSV